MNEIERAIGSLEMLRALMLFDTLTGEVVPLDTLNRDNRDLYDAAKVALTALREQAERSGCEYCDDNFKFWQTQISGELPNVRYCPMCGRRLEVEP